MNSDKDRGVTQRCQHVSGRNNKSRESNIKIQDWVHEGSTDMTAKSVSERHFKITAEKQLKGGNQSRRKTRRLIVFEAGGHREAEDVFLVRRAEEN